MKLRLVASSLALASVIAPAGVAFAQANPQNTGYVITTTTDAKNNVVRSGRYGTSNASCNLCWRTGYWTPAMAIAECDPDLVKKADPPAPAPAPAVRPAPAPAPVAPAPAAPARPPAPARPATPPPPAPAPATPPPRPPVQRITLASKALFNYDSATLKPEGQAVLDREIVNRMRELNRVELVLVTGHADRTEGNQQRAQQLSERRAAAVAAYLASKGVPRDKLETLGMGKTQPVPGVSCKMTNRKALISCLQPHRRVEVEVKGTK